MIGNHDEDVHVPPGPATPGSDSLTHGVQHEQPRLPRQAAPHLLGRWGDVLAVHKPAGLRIHPASPDNESDLIAWLDSQRDVAQGTKPIHRLDGPASGLVLCAADPKLRAEVSGWMARNEAHRTYVALVHGRTRRKGIIRRPLQDQRRGRPLPAITRYRRIDWLGAFTLVQIFIETGRKHQIRRHLQGLGHAIVGDERYRPRHVRAVPAFPGRLWLHALAMELPDGTIIEDPLPPELEQHIAALEKLGLS